MKKFLFTLKGLGIGFLIGLIFYFCQCVWSGISCSKIDENATAIVYIIAMLVGGVIGICYGAYMDAEDRAYEQKVRQENLDNNLAKWDNQLVQCINIIENSIGVKKDLNRIYSSLWEFKRYAESENDPRYMRQYATRLLEHQNRVKNKVNEKISTETTLPGTTYIIECLKALKISKDNDSNYNLVIERMNKILAHAVYETNYIKIEQYGECILELDNEKNMSYLDINVEKIEKEINSQYELCKRNNDYFDGITNYLSEDIIEKAIQLVWYYAKKRTFEVNKFENAVKLFNKFTVQYFIDEQRKVFEYRKVEAVLAKIYAINQMGGIGAVKQEMDYVRTWMKKSIELGLTKECGILASGFAWMELFEFEKEILAIMVKSGVQLSAEMQERYGFLEEGGNSNIKIYNVEESDDFIYDSSSIVWKEKEYEMFFRKLSMKKQKLNYSLAISKWTKTLPLMKGQKVSQGQLYEEFLEMIEDFDGEVTCKKVNARAINLSNIEYEDAILFEFVSEHNKRNKCVSMLFSCEKYGKNLNLTIITLFTPEKNMENDELKKYALAIKENIYIESFIESIRQSVDEVLQEKKVIYDEEESVKKIFE